MAYTKVSSIKTNNSETDTANGNAVGWKYFYETFLPTVGWTVTLCADNSASPPSAYNSNHWYFLKKTLTFTDGTTDTIAFVYKWEPSPDDLHVYSWDGVLATNDSSDPQYGRGTTDFCNDTNNVIMQGSNPGVWDIWKDDDSDAWFWLKNGRFIGIWFPNGGWVRHDFTYASGTQYLTRHVIPYPGFDENGKMARHYNNNSSILVHYPTDLPNSNKFSNYNYFSSSNYAMWRGQNSNIITRASRVGTYPNGRIYTKTFKSGSNYYFGLTSSTRDLGIHFNVGTSDPGYRT